MLLKKCKEKGPKKSHQILSLGQERCPCHLKLSLGSGRSPERTILSFLFQKCRGAAEGHKKIRCRHGFLFLSGHWPALGNHSRTMRLCRGHRFIGLGAATSELMSPSRTLAQGYAQGGCPELSQFPASGLRGSRACQGGCLEGLGGPWKLGEPGGWAASQTEGPQGAGGARGHGLTLSEALLYR